MSSLTAYDALHDWLEANWTFTARRYENDGPEPPDGLTHFLHMAVEGEAFAQMSIGAGGPDDNLWRETGFAIFTACVPSGSGVSLGRGYVSTLAEMMKGLRLSPGLTCRQMRIGAGAPFRRWGNYWGVPLTTEWYRDEPA